MLQRITLYSEDVNPVNLDPYWICITEAKSTRFGFTKADSTGFGFTETGSNGFEFAET